MAKQTSKKIGWKKVALTIGAVTLVAGSLGVAKRVVDPGETVTSVIDGDTFTISNGQNIRLFGIDAPELKYCFGKESQQALSKKILGKKVILKEPRAEKFGRVMALVYVNGELVNEFMLKNGFALSQAEGQSENVRMKAANDFARANNVGIFSDRCYQISPPNLSCVIKGNLRSIDGKKVYFLPGCSNYESTIIEKFQGEDWFCTEKEAKAAGFTKSPNCK